MAKKKKTAPKKKNTKKPAVKQVNPRETYLLVLIKATERYVTGKGDALDEMMTSQAKRLRKELEDLRHDENFIASCLGT